MARRWEIVNAFAVVTVDPFMGVGSTGVAALELDRRFVGMELEPEYFKAAKKRLQETDGELHERVEQGRLVWEREERAA